MKNVNIKNLLSGLFLAGIGTFFIIFSGFYLFILLDTIHIFSFTLGCVLIGLGIVYAFLPDGKQSMLDRKSGRLSRSIEKELERSIRIKTKPAFKTKSKTAVIKVAVTSLVTATLGILLVYLQVIYDELALPFFILVIFTIGILWANDIANYFIKERIEEDVEKRELEKKLDILKQIRQEGE